jgi:hypothetical protein
MVRNRRHGSVRLRLHLLVMCLEVVGDRALLVCLISRILHHHRVLLGKRVQNKDMHFLEMVQERMKISVS